MKLVMLAMRNVKRRKWSQTGNDPQTEYDSEIEPRMIPDVDRKWSRRKTRTGMEFIPPVEVSIFNINRSKSQLTMFYIYMDILNSHDKVLCG